MIQINRRFAIQLLNQFDSHKYKIIFEACPAALLFCDASLLKPDAAFVKAKNRSQLKTFQKKNLSFENLAALRILEVNRSTQILWQTTNDSFKERLFKNLPVKTKRVFLEGFSVLAAGADFFEQDIQIKTLQGKRRDCQLRMSVPQGSKGTLARVILSLQDLTERKKLERALRKMAHLDGLTRLFNHQAMASRLREEINRAKRYKLDLACFMIDVDHFKSINDRLGHLKGDQVLKKVATLIKDCLRRTDIVGRYGGDEFLVILPETKSRPAKTAALRIQDAFKKQMKYYQKKFSIENTLSIGISGFPSPGIKDQKALLASADRAMYKAKAIGGDHVVLA